MKKIFYLLVFLPILVIGQTTSENYVLTTVYKLPTTTTIPSPTILEANQYVTYLDGFGRPIQEVASKQSASGYNIVKPMEYDALGREEKNYLPYATQTNALDYEPNSLTDVSTFYNTTAYQNTTNPYSQKLYETSSLSRVLAQAAPGNDWEMSLNHTIKVDYQTNVTLDQVKLYKVIASWNSGTNLYDIPLTDGGFYPKFMLHKTIVKNENWISGNNNTQEEYRDNQGHLILKRTYGESIVNNTPVNTNHDTYYVYDQFGNLTYVIPPLVNTSATITQTIMDNLCYQYKYDYRNRLVEKKVPGKRTEFIIYDKLNRVIATGPAQSPFSDLTSDGWLITKYDVFNRVVLTGWMSTSTITSGSRSALQVTRNSDTVWSESKPTSPTNVTVNNVTFQYTNVAFPTGNSYHVLTINYYDDYTTNITFTPTISYSQVLGQTVEYDNTTLLPKGLPTISWVRVSDLSTATTPKAETSYVLYDYKSRPIRAFTKNFLDGYTQADSNLESITGRVNYTITTHKRVSASTAITVRDDYTYTPQDRLLTHIHKINSGTSQLISKNDYDEMGKLISKNVGGTDVTTFAGLQKVDYSYNVRGWLTGINKTEDGTNPTPLNQFGEPNDLFAFKINYCTPTNTVAPLYNGNISETYWLTSTDNRLRKYGYEYDSMNRLKNAIYQKPQSAIPIPNSYRESVTYDKNGNINHLIRNGGLDSSTYLNALQIDDLTYGYTNGNQLSKVTDATINPNGFTDDSLDGIPANDAPDYTYDLDGNMKTDDNKKITGITYNYLNLPTRIDFSNDTNTRIEYLYNANGQKVRKIVYQYNPLGFYTPISNTTDYLDGFQYKDAVLLFFPTSEGYVKNTPGSSANVYSYVYNYLDHLGNIRMSYTWNTATSSLKILEENHYYPFGLKHAGYDDEQYNYARKAGSKGMVIAQAGAATPLLFQYKFQGQERQDELGLNWDSFKWRNYDPAIGRFMSIDPLTEKYHHWSPYVFGGNQVVHSRELEGLEPRNDLNHPVHFEAEPERGESSVIESYLTPAEIVINSDEIKATIDFSSGFNETNESNNNEKVLESNDLDNDFDGNNDDSIDVDQIDDVDPIDVVDYGISGLGEANTLIRDLWVGSSNASQWKAAYQLSKTLGVGTSAIKNGINPGLKTAGRYLTGAAIAVTAYKVVSTGQVHSSDVLALSMIALGSTGIGAPIATAFFVADLLTLAITGESIGEHLDKAVGQPILDFGYGDN